jgi:hypothetical protein
MAAGLIPQVEGTGNLCVGVAMDMHVLDDKLSLGAELKLKLSRSLFGHKKQRL